MQMLHRHHQRCRCQERIFVPSQIGYQCSQLKSVSVSTEEHCWALRGKSSKLMPKLWRRWNVQCVCQVILKPFKAKKFQ